MALRGVRPTDGGGVHCWQHVGCKAGLSWEGWIAGDAVGVWVHEPDPSTPCIRRYAGSHQRCPRCDSHDRVAWIAYQPLYRADDGKQVVVILHKDQYDAIEAATLHKFVCIGRKEGHKVGLHMATVMKQREFHTVTAYRRAKVCIANWVCGITKTNHILTGAMLLRGVLPEFEGQVSGGAVDEQQVDVTVDPKMAKALQREAKIQQENAARDQYAAKVYAETAASLAKKFKLNNGDGKH